MAEYKFILSHDTKGELELTNAPEGWKDVEYTITRSTSKWGFFSEFSGTLGFLYEGKEYIDDLLDLYNVEEHATLTIKYRDPVTLVYDTIITGLLNLASYDRQEHYTYVEFEDSGFKRKLRGRSDLKVKYNNQESINGTSLPGFSTPYKNLTLRYLDESDVEQTSVIKAIYPHEAFESIIQQITDSDYSVLESDLLGRSSEHGYAENGDLSLRMIAPGKYIRGYTSTDGANYNVSLDELFNVFDRQKPIGLGFDTNEEGRDIVTIRERMDYFNPGVGLTLEDKKLNDLKLSQANEILYKAIKIGYESFLEDKEKGLSEYNTRSEWITPITVSEATLELVNSYRADGTGISDILNNHKKADTDPEKSNYDDSVFLIDSFDDSGTLKNSQNENYSVVTGVYDNVTLYYNLDITPQRILESQYGEWIAIGLQKLTGQTIKHSYAETLEDLTTTRDGDTEAISENSDIDIDSLPEPRLSGREIKFNYSFSPEEINTIRSNPEKLIKLYNYKDNTYIYGWVKEVSTRPIDGEVTNVTLWEAQNIETLSGFLELQTGAYLLLQTGAKIQTL